ncbi:hypothetical protein F5X68DRAFT_214831 [Plectosphaerella plurivora]|uniref:Uncharacterized protein n=1 Tax=Plectosphaerella plurivora TaxID=936078 RepID=A0A9P8V1U6_9PEZI|nr:hypothetical protein F5X68DRAFT_214831 [Plectosphaerella plurivora]
MRVRCAWAWVAVVCSSDMDQPASRHAGIQGRRQKRGAERLTVTLTMPNGRCRRSGLLEVYWSSLYRVHDE